MIHPDSSRVGASRRLARVIHRHRVDIVHARGAGATWAAWRAATDAGAHFLVTFDLASAQPGPLQRRYVAAMTKGECVIALSQFQADHIRQTYPVEPGRIRLIRRGIDLRSFDPDKVGPYRLAQLVRRWSLPDGVPVVMAAGRRGWVGDGVLLEALARLRNLPFRCLLVGAGEDATIRAELEAGIRHLGLADRVQLTGECADMPAAYMLADVVVSASNLPAAFVHVITEAQAMGRPVVATCHDGAEEQVLPEQTAWLVPPDEPEALGQAIAEALSLTPDQRAALSHAAIAHARACFGKERMCAQTLSLYREMLSTDAYALGPAAA